MLAADAETLTYQSKEIVHTSGSGTAVFKPSFIPKRGPNGGILKIREITLHAILNITVAGAVLLGEDAPRAFRAIEVKTVGGVKRIDNISGDSARIISYAHTGAARTHEHANMAIAATTDRTFTQTISFSKPYAYDADDTGIPSEFLEEIRVGMALSSDLTIGASTVTVHSGVYFVIAECFEEMSVILSAQDVWKQWDLATSASTDLEFDTGGRLQDVYVFVPGAQGGQTLANLTAARIEHLMPEALRKDPVLIQAYARARGAAMNSFSTKGDPLRTDPFLANPAGTLRALAVKLTTGNKVSDGAERARETLKLTLAGALPAAARVIARYTVPKSPVQRALILANHKVNSSYVKTRDKSKRELWKWEPAKLAYMPEKFVLSKAA